MRRTIPLLLLGLVVIVLGGAASAPIVRADPLLTPQIYLPQLLNPGVPLQTDLQRQQSEEVVRLVNLERAKVGCPALVIDESLVAAAQAHSADMAQRNYFSHSSLDGSSFVDRVRAAGFSGAPGGENIAAGYPNAAEVMAGWMDSDGHRENILRCSFRTIGVGYATSDSSKFFHYWTQDFGQ
jgi:uncharacterized protein YkwD